MAKRVGMVAGGTGITPMISIIRWILKRGIDVSVSLIFANKTKEDIILRDEFDNYANEYPIFKRYYLLEKAPQGWTMGTGLVTSEVMREHLPAPSDETTIFLCGPAIMEIDLRKRLGELGYEKGKLIVP
jgi:cytochrome-b5 reductase